MTYVMPNYSRLLLRVLPRGRAWTIGDDVVKQGVIDGLAQELQRVDDRSNDLLAERDTRTTVELIGEHEDELGLLASTLTTAQRRNALTTKLRALGSLHPAYYVALAATLGYTIAVEQFTPAWSGLLQSGQPCGSQQNLFFWRVNVMYDPTLPGTPVDWVAALKALIEPQKPAHSVVLYRLVGFGFSFGFSSGFQTPRAGTAFSNGFSSGFWTVNIRLGSFGTGFSTGFGDKGATLTSGGFVGSGFSNGFFRFVYT